MFFWGNAWTIIAWCELRSDYLSFRPDRMHQLEVLENEIPDDGHDLGTFLERVSKEMNSQI